MENENYSGPTGDNKLDGEKFPPIATPDENVEMALTDEDTKVSFTNANSIPLTDQSRNGDAKVNIENVKIAFAGMGKEELLKFANDPFWIKLRWSLFILFWVAWLAMMVGAIVIIFLAPRCSPVGKLDWWQKNVIYQIYPRSFQDSNGDGIGDLAGISSRLDYLKHIGISSIWLSPIFKSSGLDNGYDVDDYKSIDPDFGSMEDFGYLLSNMTDKKMKLILDFVPNHTSKKCEWFNKSRHEEPKYKDYYVWSKGKDGGPPTNWVSVFGGSAWTYDDVREEYYLHQFLPEQPDLNLRNKDVRKELEAVLRFWLDLGVSGFRVDAVSHLYENLTLLDEPEVVEAESKPDLLEYNKLEHIYTFEQPENVELVKEWRQFLNKYEDENGGGHRLLVVESSNSIPGVMQYYGSSSSKVSDFPFNFQLLKLTSSSNASDVKTLVNNWCLTLPNGSWPNWVLGNHDTSRVASRVNSELVDGLNMISLLLPGTAVTYYGEEIGMTDLKTITFLQTKDTSGLRQGETKYAEYSRDPERTPMQWSGERGAGFTEHSDTWLPINPNYQSGLNVEEELNNTNSHLNIYKSLINLRKEPSILYGSLALLDVEDSRVFEGNIFGFSRVKIGHPSYVILVNFGDSNGSVHLTDHMPVSAVNYLGDVVVDDKSYTFPESGTIEMSSSNMSNSSDKDVRLNVIPLSPYQSIVINFVPVFE